MSHLKGSGISFHSTQTLLSFILHMGPSSLNKGELAGNPISFEPIEAIPLSIVSSSTLVPFGCLVL